MYDMYDIYIYVYTCLSTVIYRSTPQASWGQWDNWSCEAVPTKTTNKTRRELVAFSGDGRTYIYPKRFMEGKLRNY